ncbi:hypothetical protein GCM10010193_12270 [Kitasatospora atroaurantiaca]
MAVPHPHAVTAEIEGVMPVTPFASVADAARVLLAAVRGFSIGEQQRSYVACCLTGVGSAEYITRCLEREGAWSLTVYLVDGSGGGARWVGHSVRIKAASWAAAR